MDKMLMQTELTVIAGDQESYKISAKETKIYVKKANLQDGNKNNTSFASTSCL